MILSAWPRVLAVGAASLSLALTACSRNQYPEIQGDGERVASVALSLSNDPERSIQKIVDVLGFTDIATMDVVPFLRTSDTLYEPISSTTGLPTTLSDPEVLKVTQDQDSIDFTRTIVFGNLRPNAYYRFEIHAYRQDGSLISDPASSSIVLQMAHDDRPVLGSLKLALINTPFSATSSITLIQGDSALNYDHVLFEIEKVTGNPEVITPISTQSLTDFNGVLNLSNLSPYTRYRGRATAFASPVETDPIAVATCDIVVTNDDQPATASVILGQP